VIEKMGVGLMSQAPAKIKRRLMNQTLAAFYEVSQFVPSKAKESSSLLAVTLSIFPSQK